MSEATGNLLYPQCSSWYLGADIAGKPRAFMPCPGFLAYVEKYDQVAAPGNAGFILTQRN